LRATAACPGFKFGLNLKGAIIAYKQAGGDSDAALRAMTTFAYKRFVKNDAGIGAPASVDAN
jgi:hypothetical protein